MKHLLDSSLVKEHGGVVVLDLIQVKSHVDVSVHECETKHPDDLSNCTCDWALHVGWLECAIVDELLVKKVVGMQLNLFRTDHYDLG